jgi:MFS transporter, ACS family, hexuronate transporter
LEPQSPQKHSPVAAPIDASSVPKTNALTAAIGNYRWRILSLVFFATTINYLDRQVISLLKDDYLEPLFKWTESDYANVVVIFQLAYAIGSLGAGWFIDRVGTKIGYAFSLVVWSLAAVGHAAARSTIGFMVARGFLGISESGNFPSALKTVAEWFPKKERALATGLFNSGANIGAIVAPLTVPAIALAWGWQWAFILTGAIGFLWLLFWFFMYEIPRKHKKLKKEEFAYIHSDTDEVAASAAEEEKTSWLKLLTLRQTWAFAVGKFLTDPVWWFYLFWLPTFLNKQYHVAKTDLMLPIAIVYTITTIGSIFGGWLSGFFISRGWAVYKARRTAMLVFACLALPVILVQTVGKVNMWVAVLFIGIAAAGHQAWSANLMTTPSDMFPKKTVASVCGIAWMVSSIVSLCFSKFVGYVLDHFKAAGSIGTGYAIVFIYCGCAYLLAWILFNVMAPRMKRVEV